MVYGMILCGRER